MLTTTPLLPEAAMLATTSRARSVAPVRLTAMTASHCALLSVLISPVSRSFFTSRPSRRMPALLTRALRPPIAPFAQATKPATSASSATSSLRACTWPGHLASDAVSARPASLTSPMATWAPASARRTAKWRPMPEAPPETMILRSLSFMRHSCRMSACYQHAGREAALTTTRGGRASPGDPAEARRAEQQPDGDHDLDGEAHGALEDAPRDDERDAGDDDDR